MRKNLLKRDLGQGEYPCTHCKKSKPESEFYTKLHPKLEKRILFSQCKKCTRAKKNRYVEENEESKERNRIYQRDYKKKWRAEHPDLAKKLNKVTTNNQRKRRQNDPEYRKKHNERHKKYMRERKKDPEYRARINQKAMEYYYRKKLKRSKPPPD